MFHLYINLFYYRKIDDLSSDSDFNVDHSPIYIQSDEGENSERENSLGNRQSSPQATTATDCVSKYVINVHAHVGIQ